LGIYILQGNVAT